jgi:fructose-1,6-bisphosphatase/inositol monophosphatase family enzyme
MSVLDTDKVSAIIRECAERYILPRYKLLEEHQVMTKSGPRDLVTQADIDVEEHLKHVLPSLLPGSIVVGEEGVSSRLISLDLLKDDTRPVWVVDPVDGTHNFVHHKREFGVMLACIINGRVEHGWIYDVLGPEMLVAERGAGAFTGDERLQVNPMHALSSMEGHLNPGYFPKEYKDHINRARGLFKFCQTLNCAAHEYMRIAKGEAQFSIYSRMKPWDHLPGALIVEEAGGYVARWDREPYAAKDSHIGLIIAASREDWDMVYDVFLKDII